ncbi:DUF6351 family protein [Bermanella sp. R86510]|uniref:DUF6351 family protein n=1 Tax=unclassified Bermanella TaxID=2627862 RepID=UPI0037CAE603
MKKWITIFAVSTVALLVAALLLFQHFEKRFLPKPASQYVVGLPSSFEREANQPGYSGLHPRQIERPQERFPFPIELGQVGPVEPLFAGPNQYPFLCGSHLSGLGQPLVDNQEGIGIKVYKASENGQLSDQIIGYSKDCQIPTQVRYYHFDDEQGQYVEGESQTAQIRVEVGSINRFIYVIALPVGTLDTPQNVDRSVWNERLIYRMKGGVGVGRAQGKVNISKLLFEHQQQLENGYAIAFSTGNETSQHYNITLSEDTALRVKQQFISAYGKPLYTIAIGGSGGAIQQYLLAQNRPGLFDGLIPLYSYPDMISQVSYALECELLEYYFDRLSDDTYWQDWERRSLIEGSLARTGFKNRYGWMQGIASALNGDFSQFPEGASLCTNGWRGSAQHINNPIFFSEYYEVAQNIRPQVDWSHWGNLSHIYGTDEFAFGRRFWGNEGVQYGLRALRNGQISAQRFLHINRHIGGWKPVAEMDNSRFWHISGDSSLRRFSVWSQHNMSHQGALVDYAPRTKGSPIAAEAAYKSGMVFLGWLDLPTIDIRHYLDEQLDMHHSMASHVSRQRIKNAMGRSDQQLIWTIEKPEDLPHRQVIQHLPIAQALAVLDKWILTKRKPGQDLWSARPNNAMDRCYDEQGSLIAEGNNVWSNVEQAGACLRNYPYFSQSRHEAGEDLSGDTLLCERISVQEAIEIGVYGPVDMSPYGDELKRIFADGVCHFPQGSHDQVKTIVEAITNGKEPPSSQLTKYHQ